MAAIIRKELADYFNSMRVPILFLLVLLVTGAGLYTAQQGIRTAGSEGFVFLRLYTTSGDVIPTLVNFMALYFLPLVGIALGFDAINSERSSGTLSRILSQPIYRDSVINGKFIAGIITMAIMVAASLLLIAGYGLRMTGVPPYPEEIIRLFLFFILTVFYGAFWIGLSILFSVIFKRIASSLLTTVIIWLFLSFFMVMIAPVIADAIVPTAGGTEAIILRNIELQQTILRFSPNILFSEASTVLLHPVLLETQLGYIDAIASGQTGYMLANPLSIGQSMLVIWPHLTSLISLSVVCFGITYVVFMRQEVRAT